MITESIELPTAGEYGTLKSGMRPESNTKLTRQQACGAVPRDFPGRSVVCSRPTALRFFCAYTFVPPRTHSPQDNFRFGRNQNGTERQYAA